MPKRSIIQFAAMFAVLAIALGAEGLSGAGTSRAALPPVTARTPDPAVPPLRRAVLRARKAQRAGWPSVASYLDALARWHAPPWPVEPTAAMQCPPCRPGWVPVRSSWRIGLLAEQK